MSNNALIIEKLEADNYLAQIPEKSISETGRQALQQAQLITDGFTRLTWYSSCFFDNYQDVCSRLKNEDIRFARALLQLIKRRDVIIELETLYFLIEPVIRRVDTFCHLLKTDQEIASDILRIT